MNPLLPPPRVSFTVIGDPAPQGSKRAFNVGKFEPGKDRKSVMVESSKRVKPWRDAVHAAAFDAKGGQPPMDGPLALTLIFWLPMPTTLSKRKAAMGPFRKPDLSKLLRSTEDAITTAGLVADDARFVRIVVEKRFVLPAGHCGALVTVEAC